MHQLLAPWRRPGHLWRSLAYVASALPVGSLTFAAIVALLAGAASSLFTFVLIPPAVWLLFWGSQLASRLERSRTAALMGEVLADPVPPLESPGWIGRLWERVRSRARWRGIGYHLAQLPVHVVTTSVVVLLWCGGAALLALPAYAGALPGGTAKFWLFEVGPGTASLALALLGALSLVVLAPWATEGLASLQLAMARTLLGRASEAELAAWARRAEEQRAAAVGSAEAERRRIERDLHDGAQQRLVALAASLGEAREKLDVDPATGKALVATAHEEAKAALKEIRDLVRGIHPVILEDRGLDAALSAVVARAPVPVSLHVRVAERPSPEAESTAYFVVSEALANVARHAEATRASVAIERAGDRLVVEVHDDGTGGADASHGTGLQGLRERVTGMGGTMHVISPPGGPTTISVELPCGS